MSTALLDDVRDISGHEAPTNSIARHFIARRLSGSLADHTFSDCEVYHDEHSSPIAQAAILSVFRFVDLVGSGFNARRGARPFTRVRAAG